jgi:sigma-B regulation protein RsbU (phosphoserine phosphatase)
MHRSTKIRQARRSGIRSSEQFLKLPTRKDERSCQERGSQLSVAEQAFETEVHSLREDLSEAAQVQRLLNGPRELRRGDYEIACETFPVRQISGDFCTVFDVGDRTVFAVGDIAGKGLIAGMWFTHIVSLVRFHAGSIADPGAAMSAVNRELCSLSLERPLITVFLGSLDSSTNTLSYCRAGHPPPVIIHADSGPELAHTGGPVLGVLQDAEFEAGTAVFDPGDSLLAYSDGLSELRNEQGEEFGIRRLLDEVERCERSSATRLLFSMLGTVKDFAGGGQPQDDITVMAMLRHQAASVLAEKEIHLEV